MDCDKPRSRCPINFAVELFGDRWTLLVIRDLVLLGKRRFTEFAASDEKIATNILSDRLKRLAKRGIIESRQDPKDKRRVLYQLTEVGLDLIPPLIEIAAFGAKHDPDTAAPAEFTERYQNDREGFIADVYRRHREALKKIETQSGVKKS
ncbi:MAG: helix-turn-helix domain-containing protein [Planctomycetota bacterium]|nr:helix-turn-helix domain-containing protein [Planctomycetota bacterium]